jgi:glycosyltransferase involved in cell wall biosynthesis
MKFSIIIATRNRELSLRDTLQSLRLQQYPSTDFEVIVVDNGSLDGTRETVNDFIRQYPEVNCRFEVETMPGNLAARQLAVQLAANDVLVFLDDDVQVSKTYLAALAEAFTSTAAEIVGGPAIPRFQSDPPKWFWETFSGTPYGGKMNIHYSLIELDDLTRTVDPNLIWSQNMAIKKSTYINLGGFHPCRLPAKLLDLFGDGETGLTKLAAEQKLVCVYTPGALVHHLVPTDRLDWSYLRRRAVIEGIAISFATIRELPNEFDEPMSKRDALVYLVAILLLKLSSTVIIACERFSPPRYKGWLINKLQRQGFNAGYKYHQVSARVSPKLRNWVRQETFWQCSVAPLEADTTLRLLRWTCNWALR